MFRHALVKHSLKGILPLQDPLESLLGHSACVAPFLHFLIWTQDHSEPSSGKRSVQKSFDRFSIHKPHISEALLGHAQDMRRECRDWKRTEAHASQNFSGKRLWARNVASFPRDILFHTSYRNKAMLYHHLMKIMKI